MNVGAFLVLTQLSGFEEKLRTTADYTGLGRRRPVLAAALTFFLLSMIGIPFTAGFFAKFYVFAGAFAAGHKTLVIIGLLNSGVACFYYLRLILALYTNDEALYTQQDRGETESESISFAATLAIAACAAAVLMMGILPAKVLSHAERAAHILLPNEANIVTLPTVPCGGVDSNCSETR